MRYIVDRLDIVLIFLSGMLIGLMLAISVALYFDNEKLTEMERDAVMYEYGDWDLDGKFEWNELSMEVQYEKV